MKKSLLLLSVLSVFSVAHADAGSLLREAKGALPSVSYDMTTSDTLIQVQKIVLAGNTLLPADEVRAYLERSAPNVKSLAQLQALAGELGDIYHQAGYPLATVIVPVQTIEGGQVVLQAIEGKVDAIALENRSKIHDQVIKDTIAKTVRFGKPLHSTESERAQLLIGDLAGTAKVGYRLDKEGLVLQVEPAAALDGFVQMDNYGSKSTGEVRTRAGVSLNSPFGQGEKLSVQAMTSFKGVHYARLSADMPVGGDGLVVSAGVGHTRYELGGAFKDLNATGEATSVDVGVRYPGVRSHANSLWLTAGIEHRDLQDKVKSTDTITDKSLQAVRFGLNGYHQDNLLAGGYTQWSADSTIGKLSIDSSDARAIDNISTKTAGTYHKITANIARTQYLNPKFSINLSANGQLSNKNLDSAEQFSLGGVDGVSAYHFNDVSADSGFVGQAELRYAIIPNLLLSGFYETGSVKLRQKPFANTNNRLSLQGVGLGVQGNYKHFYLSSKLSWRTSDEKFSYDKKPRLWLKAGVNF